MPDPSVALTDYTCYCELDCECGTLAFFGWADGKLQSEIIFLEDHSVTIQLGTATGTKASLNCQSVVGGQVTSDTGTPNDSDAWHYTVTASAEPGYEYAGYTLTTQSETTTVPWDWETVGYTYGTKTIASSVQGDTTRSTATFDVTITEDAELEFHFKELEPEKFFEGVQPSLFKGTEETWGLSLTRASPPKDQVPVKSYKAGDWAYINIFAPLHGSVSYAASQQSVRITVYQGEGTTGTELRSGYSKFATGTKGSSTYPTNSNPTNSTGLSLDLRLQLPESDYITVEVYWPYFDYTWTFPIKVMDTTNQHMEALRSTYNNLAAALASGYNPFRYYLKTVYEEESAKLLEMSETEQASYISEALERVKGAAKGEGADAVVWRFKGAGHGSDRLDSLPILVAVPPDTTNGHDSMIAALDAAFPGNWTYRWTSGSFGPIVSHVTWGDPELDKGEVICNGIGNFEYGNYGSFFNDRDGYSQVGVGGYPATDGAIMAWNSSVTIDQWHYALLRWYWNHDDDALALALAAKDTTVDDAILLKTEELENLFINVDLDGNGVYDDDFRHYGLFREVTPASEVMRLIDAIGGVNLQSGEAIQKARAAYNGLSDEEKAKVRNISALEAAEKAYVLLTTPAEEIAYQSALGPTLTAMIGNKPQLGSVWGEWALMTLARFYGGNDESMSQWFSGYQIILNEKLAGGDVRGSALDPNGTTPTEYSRTVIGLTSMGADASAYEANGVTYELTYKLKDLSAMEAQGINAVAFGLIALDTKPYYPDDQDIRNRYVNSLLDRQTGKGWSYSSAAEADPDMTAMVIQALAPYYNSNSRVKTAVDNALLWLKDQQTPHGGFISSGKYNSESAAQVVVALCALKIDPTAWGNKCLLNALLSFYDGSSAFKHLSTDKARDPMSTEQAAYALVAYHRFLNSSTSLYDMSDLFGKEEEPDPADILAAAEKTVRTELEQYAGFPENPDNNSVTNWATSKLAGLKLDGVTYEVTVNGITPPAAGTSDNPEGTPGKVEFTVTLTTGSGSTQVSQSISFTMELPAQRYLSNDTTIESLTFRGIPGVIDLDKKEIRVTLPVEYDVSGTISEDDFDVKTRDEGANVYVGLNLDSDKGIIGRWRMAVIAADGVTETLYFVTITVAESEDEFIAAQVDAARSILLEAAHEKPLPSGIVTETNAGSVDKAKSSISDWLNSLLTGDLAELTRTVEVLTYNAPTISADGSYTAKVTFTIKAPAAAPASESAEEDDTTASSADSAEPAGSDESAELMPPADGELSEPDEEHFSFEFGGSEDEDEGKENGQEEQSVPPQEDQLEQQVLSVVSNAFHEVEAQADDSGETYVVVNISGTIPKLPYTASTDTGVTSVSYWYGGYNSGRWIELTREGSAFTLQLESGMDAPTSSDNFRVTCSDSKANVRSWEKTTAGWRFTVEAENGATYTYTVIVNAAPTGPSLEENMTAVETVAAKVSRLDEWDVDMSAANNAASLATFIQTKLIMAGLNGVKAAVDVTFKPATAGTASNPQGTIGNYSATVTLSKGSGSALASKTVEVSGYILPTAYEAKPTGDITVYFTLLGDTAHGDPGTTNTHTLADRNLDTWIPTQEVTVPAGSTVGDVFSMVLDEWGYRYIGLEKNYIKTIITPKGLSLSEFTNGQLSGWMYTVNGEHPNQGLNKWEVFDGDEIIWHYTDDYTKERGGTGTNTGSSSGELNPTVSGGSASVSTSAFEDAIDAALQNRLSEILISPAGASRLDSLSVNLPTDALYEAARSGLGITVESGAGIVTIPSSALSGIARAAGSTVTIVTAIQNSNQAENLLSDEELTDEQLTNCSVTEVSIISGRSNITNWGGSSITLSLPVDSRYFEARERYTVYQISDNGSVEKHTGRCVKSGSTLYVEVDVSHLSTFVVIPAAMEIIDEEEVPEDALPTSIYLPFADTANHWALDSIGYVYQWGLMTGTSAYTFQPEADTSRAMFVTVLHRMEGAPASASANVYNDVAAGTWYTDAVTWATSAGIVNGTGAGKFSPNASITREEMATMMMRYAKYKGYDTAAAADLADYADSYQINEWAYRAMEWANGTGMITGRTAFTLVPQGTATRAETATILVRFIQKFAPNMY